MKLIPVFMLLFAVGGCFLLPEEEERVPPPVIEPQEVNYQTTEVERTTLSERVEVLSYFQPAAEETLFFAYSGGRLERFYCRLGDRVVQGQLLAALRIPDVRSDYRKQELLLEKAELTLEKYRAMNADRFRIRSAEIDVELARIRLQDLRRVIDSATIVSPIDGVVVYRAGVGTGDTVEAYRTLVSVADPESLRLVYNGASAVKFKTGMDVSVELSGRTYSGTVLSTPDDIPVDAPASERNTAVFAVASLPEDVERGDIATVSAVLWEKENVIAVPNQFIHSYKGSPFVNVLRQGIKREQPVKLGVATATMTEIVDGLQAGDQLLW